MRRGRNEPFLQWLYRKTRRRLGRVLIVLVIVLSIIRVWASLDGFLSESDLATESDIASDSDADWRITRWNLEAYDFGSDTEGPGVVNSEELLSSSLMSTPLMGMGLLSSGNTTVTARIIWADDGDAMALRPGLDVLPNIELNYGDDSDILLGTLSATGVNEYTITWDNVPTEYNGSSITDYQISIAGLIDTDADGTGDFLDYYSYPQFTGSGSSYQLTAKLNATSHLANLYVFNTGAINGTNGAYFTKPTETTAYLVDEHGAVLDQHSFTTTTDVSGNHSWAGNSNHYLYALTKDIAGNDINTGTHSIIWSSEFTGNGQYETRNIATNQSGAYPLSQQTVGGRLEVYPRYHYYYNIPVTFSDNDNVAGTRTDNMSLSLYRLNHTTGTLEELKNSDTLTVPITQSSANITVPSSWRYLPSYAEDGAAYTYYVVLNNLPAYYSLTNLDTAASASQGKTILGDATVVNNAYNRSTMITEKLNLSLKTQSMTATVDWTGDGIGGETEMSIRPSSVILRLYYTADDGATWQEYWGESNYSVSMGSNQNSWTHTWNDLPSVDKDGNPIKFRVEQVSQLNSYTTTTGNPSYTQDVLGNVTHTTQNITNNYNDNWNYKVDLYWDRSNPAEMYDIYTVTTDTSDLLAHYVLSISTQKEYEVGELQIELPYELFDGRSGSNSLTTGYNRNPGDLNKGVVLEQVSLGDEDNPTEAYSFTYRIEDNGTEDTSDDKIIFYNYKELTTAGNVQITVRYRFKPEDVVDLSRGELKAHASGKYKGQTAREEQDSNTISYTLDTGLSFNTTSTSKTVSRLVRYWESSWGTQPADFDMTQYNYVLYVIYLAGHSNNQPSTMTITEVPEDGGEVVRVTTSLYSSNAVPINTVASTDDQGNPVYTTSWSYSVDAHPSSSPRARSYYTLVRYPRESHIDPDTGLPSYTKYYRNTATMSYRANDTHEGDKGENDKNDYVTTTKQNGVLWEDYSYKYTGQIFSLTKNWSSSVNGIEETRAPLTVLGSGVDVKLPFTVTSNVYGYNLTNGYAMEVIDDNVYVRDTISGSTGAYQRLTENDYELSGRPNIYIRSSRVDRTNGQTITGYVPTEPFKLWGRKGHTAAWEELASFNMLSASGMNYTPVADISGQGYTALKVTSPEGLDDRFEIRLSSVITLKASSPIISNLLANGDNLEYLNVTNFAATNYFVPDGDGNYQRVNVENTASANSPIRASGIQDRDMEEYGYKPYRYSVSKDLDRALVGSMYTKTAQFSYDVTNEIVSASYTLTNYEAVNTRELPTEFYENHSQDKGIFYDLLPYGFSLDRTKGVTGYGATNSYPISIEDIETINDYKGTGRQMVIIKTESLRAAGDNWYNWNYYSIGDRVYPSYRSGATYQMGRRTGASITFYARAGYNDITTGESQYNIAAFQRGDGQDVWGGDSEDGYDGDTQDSNIYINTESGVPALRDLNEDGVISEKNTLYTHVVQTPDYIQTIETGLAKLVNARSGYYVTDDIVDLGDEYSYKLRFTTTQNGVSKNVVLYDILENAENTGGHSGESPSWKGKLKSVNTLNARLQGIDTVVYYSTQANLSYNSMNHAGYLPENDPSVWSTTAPSDLSTVTALAFDFRKALDGTEYEFADNQTVVVEIFMEAPSSLQSTPYSYNRPAYNSTFRPNGSPNSATSFNISNRTSLQLKMLQDFSFTKVFEHDGSLQALGGITFSLYQCTESDTNPSHTHTGTPGQAGSCWGTTALQTVSSTSDGTVLFTSLDTGTYAIYETASRTGFTQLIYRYWTIEVDATNGTVSTPTAHRSNESSSYPIVEMEEDTEDFDGDGDTDEYLLENPRPKKTLYIRKYWTEDGTRLLRPANITYDLYRNDVLYDTKTFDANLNSGQTIGSFTDLYVYDEHGDSYTYRIEERAVAGYQPQVVSITNSSSSSQTLSFTNIRQGLLSIEKLEKDTETSLEYDFTVTLKDSDGNPISSTGASGDTNYYTLRRYATKDASIYTEEQVTSDSNGVISFKLKNKEFVRLYNLPLNASYTIKEAESEIYTATVTAGSLTGTTNSTNNPIVTVTNQVDSASLPNTGSREWLMWMGIALTGLVLSLLSYTIRRRRVGV